MNLFLIAIQKTKANGYVGIVIKRNTSIASAKISKKFMVIRFISRQFLLNENGG